MVTINKVMEMVDGMTPNTVDAEAKFQWISSLDGMISRVIMEQDEPVSYVYPDDMDKPLLVDAPYDGIYGLYLKAMIHFHHMEYDDYNNAMLMFNDLLEQFKAAYIRANSCGKAKNFRNVMG